MTIENYLSQPESERKEIVQNASLITSPFWLCQLQTAIFNHSPTGLSFSDKRLNSEYWVLISKN